MFGSRSHQQTTPWVASLSMADRANPVKTAGRYALPRSSNYLKIIKEVRAANIEYMLAKLAAQGGVVLGYHGTTTPNAEGIISTGPQNRLDEERHVAFSVWDESVPLEAIRFAKRRSEEAGLRDSGRIVLVEMHGPQGPFPDEVHGRLEWAADGRTTRVLGVYTPEELMQLIGQTAIVPQQRLAS